MKAIVAMDLNRGLGYQGKIPWSLPLDLKFFKEKTTNPKTGGILLMGRKTFDSVGILPQRYTYVLTNSHEKLSSPIKDTRYSFINDESFLRIMEPSEKIWLVGGSEAYKKFIPFCTEVYVTIVIAQYLCDTKLHYFEDDFPTQELLYQYPSHWVVKYSRTL